MTDANLMQVVPPTDLEEGGKRVLFEYFFRKLASYRNDRLRFAESEEALNGASEKGTNKQRQAFETELDRWANDLLHNIWDTCQVEGGMSHRIYALQLSAHGNLRMPHNRQISGNLSPRRAATAK